MDDAVDGALHGAVGVLHHVSKSAPCRDFISETRYAYRAAGVLVVVLSSARSFEKKAGLSGGRKDEKKRRTAILFNFSQARKETIGLL